VLLFKASEGIRRWLAAGCLAVTCAAVAMTGSRGAFVGFLVVVPAIFFAMKDVSVTRRLGVVGAFVAALVLGAPQGYWERIETVFEPSEDYNVTDDHGRLAIAQRGLGYMMTYPVLGVGVANFSRAEGTISPLARNAMSGEAIRFLAPHNTYVQVGAELGVFAIAIWLSLFYLGIVGLRRLRATLSRRGRAGGEKTAERRFLVLMCTYLPITFLAFATTSFFVSHAYTPVFYVLLALLAGTLTESGALRRRDRATRIAMRGMDGRHRLASAIGRSASRRPRSRTR